jgi:putative DNA primase/helicase
VETIQPDAAGRQAQPIAAVPDHPVAPTPNFDACHPQLLPLPWVLWQYEWKAGRWTKVPKQANSRNASSTNPDTWITAAEVQQTYAKGGFDGAGLVTTADDPYIFIDLDHVIGKEWAGAILKSAQAEGAYIERSPSGGGYHIIGRGAPLAKDVGKKRNDAEVYSSGRYFTFTGNVEFKPDGPLGELIETRRLVLARINMEPDPEEALLERARKAKNGAKFKKLFDDGDISSYPSASEAELRLASILCFWFGRDAALIERLMRRSALDRSKWDENPGYLPRTIVKAIRDCKEVFALPASAATEDFHAYLPMQKTYIFVPTRDLWPASSVDSQIPPVEMMKASAWLAKYRAVHQMT